METFCAKSNGSLRKRYQWEISMEFKIIREEEGFLAEKESWTALYQSNAFHGGMTPFQSFEWCYNWWKYREDKDSLFIIKAFTCGKIEGYAPLIVRDKMVEFIGGRDMDYGRFLINDSPFETIAGFINVIKEQKYGFALQEMAARDTQLHIVQRLLEKEKKYLSHRTTRTMYIETAVYPSFEGYLKTLSSAMRNKTIKVAFKKGITMRKEKYCAELQEDIRRIYTSRQTVRGGAGSIEWAFPILEELCSKDLAEIYVASVEEKNIGFLVSLVGKYGKNIWLVAFDVEYSSYFPGQMLFYQAIKDGFEEGCSVVDFMRGDYDFKARWNAQLDSNYTVYVFRKRLRYWKSKFKFWIRPKLKKIVYGNKVLKKWYKKHAK